MSLASFVLAPAILLTFQMFPANPDSMPPSVWRVIGRHRDQLQSCFEGGRASNARGTWRFEVYLKADGTVARTELDGASVFQGDLAPCLSAAISTWQFRPPGAREHEPVKVTLVFGKDEGFMMSGEPELNAQTPREVVERVRRAHESAARECLERQLLKHPQLHGRVALDVRVAEDGTASKVRLKSSTLHNPEVEKCLVEHAREWSYPTPKDGKATERTVPFVFRSDGA